MVRTQKKFWVKEVSEHGKTLKIKLVKSLNGRLEKQITTAYSLGLKKIGQTTEQPDNAATRGKIKTIIHLIEVTE